jgi:hypothetical protein
LSEYYRGALKDRITGIALDEGINDWKLIPFSDVVRI